MARQSFSQTPAILDLSLTSGDDWGIQLTFTDAAGDPIDLSAYTFTCELSLAGDVVQTITVTNTNLANGVIDLSLTDSQTASLDGPYRWYLTYVNGSDTLTPVAGQMSVLQRNEAR